MSKKLFRDLTVFCVRKRRFLYVLTAALFLLLWSNTYLASVRIEPIQSVLRISSTAAPSHSAKLAMFIQAYERTIPLLPSLLEAIWHPDNVYAIHIDKRTPPEMLQPVHRLLEHANYSSNVYITPRQYVTYLGITTVLNTLNGISFLLEKDDTWDYFMNLSGADYPLVTAHQMRHVLGHPEIVEKKLSFIQTTNYSNAASGRVYNDRFYRINIDSATYSDIRPHDPYDEQVKADPCVRGCLQNAGSAEHPLFDTEFPVHVVKSEAWVILHRSAAEFSLRSPLSRQLIAFFANVYVPEEFFFSTLLSRAEKMRDTIVHDAFRLVLWGMMKRGSRPPAIDSGDIPNITEVITRKGGLFVRKRMKAESEVRAYIDSHLLGVSEEAQRNEEMRKSSEQFSRRQGIRVLCASRHHLGHIFTADTYPQFQRCLRDMEYGA